MAPSTRDTRLRQAAFVLRVVQRQAGQAAIVYRREVNAAGLDRLHRVAAISPLAFSAGRSLLRDAVRAAGETESDPLVVGGGRPLDNAWGARVACYGLIALRVRDGSRLLKAADHMRQADAAQAAWWLGAITREGGARALRALRILTEAVQ